MFPYLAEWTGNLSSATHDKNNRFISTACTCNIPNQGMGTSLASGFNKTKWFCNSSVVMNELQRLIQPAIKKNLNFMPRIGCFNVGLWGNTWNAFQATLKLEKLQLFGFTFQPRRWPLGLQENFPMSSTTSARWRSRHLWTSLWNNWKISSFNLEQESSGGLSSESYLGSASWAWPQSGGSPVTDKKTWHWKQWRAGLK